MIRVIGDIHGNTRQYLHVLKNATTSVQIGDLAFSYDFYESHGFKNLKYRDHYFFPGNHDHYDRCFKSPYCLGSFGMREFVDGYSGAVDSFFFVRGADSIDRKYRIVDVTWWEQEEMREEEFHQALELYADRKPSIVLSHDCPQSVVRHVFRIRDISRTRHYLQCMLDVHRPKFWIFGHHHIDMRFHDGRTTFMCLGEFSYVDILAGKPGQIYNMNYNPGIE